jgi:deazaflavin-dependent oxidoreductase (nitroreductase family)
MLKKQADVSGSTHRRPPWVMSHLVDPLTLLLVGRMGMDDHNGTRVLEVKGRRSGTWRATPVKLLEMDGRRYLVAMYGQTNWVRNLRAQSSGHMRLGNQVMEFQAVELADADKLPVLRAYFKRWWSLVAAMTQVSSPDAPDEEFASAAPQYPVFLLN